MNRKSKSSIASKIDSHEPVRVTLLSAAPALVWSRSVARGGLGATIGARRHSLAGNSFVASCGAWPVGARTRFQAHRAGACGARAANRLRGVGAHFLRRTGLSSGQPCVWGTHFGARRESSATAGALGRSPGVAVPLYRGPGSLGDTVAWRVFSVARRGA